MRSVAIAVLSLAACACAAPQQQHQAAEPDIGPGWVYLFNGENLDGWTAHYFGEPVDARPASSMFCVEQGMLHLYCDAAAGAPVSQGFIQTNSEYGDAVVHLEYRWGDRRHPPRADVVRDSGLMYFGYDNPPGNWPRTMESQIQENDTGDIWGLSTQFTTRRNPTTQRYDRPSLSEEITLGRYGGGANGKHGRMSEVEGWNSVDVVMRGDSASHIINGHVNNRAWNIRRWDEAGQAWVRLDRGRISIQAEAAEMYIRNIRIRPLSAVEGQPESDQ